jgi:hypothetical protein
MEGSKQGTFAKNGDPSDRIAIDFVGTKGPIRYVNHTSRTVEVYQERSTKNGKVREKKDPIITRERLT